MLCSENHVRKTTTRRPLAHQGTPGAHCSPKPKYEAAIKQGGLALGGFQGNKGGQAADLKLGNSNPDEIHKVHKREASPRRDPGCGHGERTEGELRFLPNPQRLPHLLPLGVHQNKVIHTSEKAETCARIRGGAGHVSSKRSLMSAPWKKTESISQCKVLGQDTLLQKTRCAIKKTN